MFRKTLLTGSLSLLALAGANVATAADLKYTFVDVGLASVDVDNGGDGDVLFARGSYEFSPNWFVFGGISKAEFDVGPFDVDVDTLDFGAGAHFPITSQVDFVGKLKYVDVSVDGPGDDDGFGLSAGLRARPLAAVEVEGSIEYVDLDEAGDDTSARLGARYYFTSLISAGAEVQFSDDAKTYGIYARFTF